MPKTTTTSGHCLFYPSGCLTNPGHLIAAILKPAITNYSDIAEARKGSKVEIISMIQAISQLAGKRLTSTMIAKLFHAYAQDKDREALIDTDLPEGESLRKAIKRHIGPWNDLFRKPDNKK